MFRIYRMRISAEDECPMIVEVVCFGAWDAKAYIRTWKSAGCEVKILGIYFIDDSAYDDILEGISIEVA